MASKRCVGKEGQWEVDRRPEEGLSQGFLPLPSIDFLVDNASGFRLLSFLDALSGYNQIRMHPKDENKTTFMDEFANYCYKVMPFVLKNANTTYQRLMDRVLTPMLRRTCRRMRTTWSSHHKRDQHIADLDLQDEVCEHARINSEALKKRVELRQKIKTKARQFKVSNLVMRKAHPYQLDNKLSLKWAGPFCVVEVLGMEHIG